MVVFLRYDNNNENDNFVVFYVETDDNKLQVNRLKNKRFNEKQ